MIMKNTVKLFLIVLSSCSVTVADEHTPSELVGQVHPKALRQFMETQDDLKEMLSLYDIFYTRIKGGIVSADYEPFCRSISKSFTFLFDKYFGDEDKWNAAKRLITEEHNKLMIPGESIEDLVWVERGNFNIDTVPEVKAFQYRRIDSKLPHELLEAVQPRLIVQFLEKKQTRQELLTLYTIYLKYAEKDSAEFGNFCQLLKNSFDFLFDRYFSSLSNKQT
ncbi:uncharacterized protein LOC126847424 [Adelges cooleyi]|uniref:uncharacterized protein LOC126847424 n=1 Tax=Adelges cooleyi TaxID=133065 RepID=UPI00217F5D10|nr:uncharacterized protein LOC126847424 [Adelges cooleyi]